ncbi:hypothetical protein FA95DRAFT_1614016 [Auriscalpium vulgare]|uniref:Uncharacterized protein n=1 Tax=Auriscalpium vulgare TaxID=40419 RepID=A0ACB8R290_9AGAM|nr:hypothetical protein FA95DRAFT_1614016 [Auriscalpium vulgare]
MAEESLHQNLVSELAYRGEAAHHVAAVPFSVRVTQIILNLPFCYLQSVGRCAYRTFTSRSWTNPSRLPPGSLSSDPDLVGRLWHKRGLSEHHLANDRAMLEYFVRGAQATELRYENASTLGKRTKF